MTPSHPRLFIGPMSKEIVGVALNYSTSQNVKLGFIPSRRQIESTGGYVNGWTTAQFAQFADNQNVLLVRDHGGPGQGQLPDDGIASLEEDIRCGFDVLHIDPWKCVSSMKEGVVKTQKLIEHCCTLSDVIKFEIGTEEAIFPYSSDDLEKMILSLKKSLGKKFDRIEYAVVQSGVKIRGIKNIGNFNPNRLKKMTAVCRNYGLLSKEHNGDYLSASEIRTRACLGLDCLNIAPEFGVLQTSTALDIFSSDEFKSAYKKCLDSKRWVKWFSKGFIPSDNMDLVVRASGHYMFTEEPFKSVNEKVSLTFERRLLKRYAEIVSCWDGI
jgi:hypothetical protein